MSQGRLPPRPKGHTKGKPRKETAARHTSTNKDPLKKFGISYRLAALVGKNSPASTLPKCVVLRNFRSGRDTDARITKTSEQNCGSLRIRGLEYPSRSPVRTDRNFQLPE